MLLARDDIGIQDVEHHTAKENQVSMLLNADRKKMKLRYLGILSVFVLSPIMAQDKILETDWLKPNEGSQGEHLGAEVQRVQTDEEQQVTVIDISLPLENAEQYEDVEVITFDQGIPLKQLKPHEWINDYEKGDYGLRIFLKRNPIMGFRVRLIDIEDDKQRGK